MCETHRWRVVTRDRDKKSHYNLAFHADQTVLGLSRVERVTSLRQETMISDHGPLPMNVCVGGYNLNYDSHQPLFYQIAKIERCVECASIATCEYALIYTFRS